jgi:hypothetical protein
MVGYIGMITAGGVTTTTGTFGQSQVSSVSHPGVFFIFAGLVFIAMLLALVISIFWFFRFSKAINQYTNGKMTTAVTFLVLWLIHLIGVALIQDAFNDMQGAPAVASSPPQNPQTFSAQPAAPAGYVAPTVQVGTNNMPPQVQPTPQFPGPNSDVSNQMPNQGNQPQPPIPAA